MHRVFPIDHSKWSEKYLVLIFVNIYNASQIYRIIRLQIFPLIGSSLSLVSLTTQKQLEMFIAPSAP